MVDGLVANISEYSVFFVKKKKGWYLVYPKRDPLPGSVLGSVLKVKGATDNAAWVFIPTAKFRRSSEIPYKHFCFGNTRRRAVANFCNNRHLKFRTGSVRPWIKSTVGPEATL